MNSERLEQLAGLEEALGYKFRDPSFLDCALTHRSFANENPDLLMQDNERLEFLGDAVLTLCITDMLVKKFPECTEGDLSKVRSSIVNERPLAGLARELRIGEYLLLGRGRTSPAVARRAPCWPTRSRPSSPPYTVTPGLRAPSTSSGRDSIPFWRRGLPASFTRTTRPASRKPRRTASASFRGTLSSGSSGRTMTRSSRCEWPSGRS